MSDSYKTLPFFEGSTEMIVNQPLKPEEGTLYEQHPVGTVLFIGALSVAAIVMGIGANRR